MSQINICQCSLILGVSDKVYRGPLYLACGQEIVILPNKNNYSRNTQAKIHKVPILAISTNHDLT